MQTTGKNPNFEFFLPFRSCQSKKKLVSLYFHIPFCKKKCDYCHFYVVLEKEEAKEKLLEAFLIELALRLPLLEGCEIVSIYFGGGTPSLFSPFRIQKVLDWIFKRMKVAENCEITLEANPESATFEEMRAYKEAGINRASLGIQSLQADLLTLLGRNHHPIAAVNAVSSIVSAGIVNLSVDLMYDLPEQTLKSWESTLVQVAAMPITHLSLYNLTIEPHTLFFKKQKELKPLLPDEESSLEMYEMAQTILEGAGLFQYEISAFAKEGFVSRHNSGYWTGREFLGFGPSAFSYWGGKRFSNIAHLNRYFESLDKKELPIGYEELLDEEASKRELIVIALRLFEGVCLEEFQTKFGTFHSDIKKELNQLVDKGFLSFDKKRYRLTQKGVLFYDTVAAELI